jgi:hypothetical protein
VSGALKSGLGQRPLDTSDFGHRLVAIIGFKSM